MTLSRSNGQSILLRIGRCNSRGGGGSCRRGPWLSFLVVLLNSLRGQALMGRVLHVQAYPWRWSGGPLCRISLLAFLW